MSGNEPSLEAMAEEAKKVIDDSDEQKAQAEQPVAPVAAEHQFTPWDKVGFITIGPKGVYLAPKGSGYPKPTSEAPKKEEEEMGKKDDKTAGMEAAGKLTPEEAIRKLEERFASLEAKIAELAKPKEAPKPEDEEMKKKKDASKCAEDPKAEQEQKKPEPVPPKAQEPAHESADHSASSPWASTLTDLRKKGKV